MILFHGGDTPFNHLLSPKMMLPEAGATEGVGTYFTPTLDVASRYGTSVMSLAVDENYFVESRDYIRDTIGMENMALLIAQAAMDKNVEDGDSSGYDSLWYMITDYGFDVDAEYVSENVTAACAMLASSELLCEEETRNFQIDLAQRFSVNSFVDAWNKILPNVYGTHYHVEGSMEEFCVINLSLQIAN